MSTRTAFSSVLALCCLIALTGCPGNSSTSQGGTGKGTGDGPISEAETYRRRYPDSQNPNDTANGPTYSARPGLPKPSPVVQLEQDWRKAYSDFIRAQKEWGAHDPRTEKLHQCYKKLDEERSKVIVNAAR
jgi:hypothetical protein